ncbi:homeobox domain-containing protein [Xylariales sp. AK1849]|nr:homeobox domain-containing protein [Xylariales sp. AK1849]
MQYPEDQYSVYPGFNGLQYMYASQQPPNDYPPERSSSCDGKTESKPRLSKDEVEKLEKIFQENPKPSSSVKAQLADGLGLERPRINNWFQNRRAKAKQERKQEEYEARRAVEKAGSAPISPMDIPPGISELFDHNPHDRMKPSSALFPDMGSAPHSDHSLDGHPNDEDDAACDSESFDSPFVAQLAECSQGGRSVELQSPLSLDFPSSDGLGFAYSQASQTFNPQGSMHSYASFTMQDRSSADVPTEDKDFARDAHRLPSPEEQTPQTSYQADHYLKLVGTGYPSTALPFFQPTPIVEERESVLTQKADAMSQDGDSNSHIHDEQTVPSVCEDLATPSDSFKSPPPPANIASRRNIQRPAALSTASLRGRAYNPGCGPKTAFDGQRRADPASPATAMRRIVSASGSMAGRIQKSIGPRSPLFLNRNTEAYLQYHSRSPVGILSAAFSGAAPPTPMTPVVMGQGVREPTVSSTCSDDEAFMLGHGASGNLMHDFKVASLKTPPETPGLITNLGAHNFSGHPFSASIDFGADQALLTPYFQTEFPELSLRHVPGYVDLSDNSLPSTPLYPNMMSSAAHDLNAFPGSVAGNTQYDWDANESITSSRSSPEQPRSRQIQFTPNITPQDYNTIQER